MDMCFTIKTPGHLPFPVPPLNTFFADGKLQMTVDPARYQPALPYKRPLPWIFVGRLEKLFG
jgi:hypothetical protein